MGTSTITAAVALGAALALALAGAGPAAAAFPGRDGQLAVQPEHGGGMVLVRADGSGEHKICADQSCSPVAGPSWSPDGRMIAFWTPTHSPAQVPEISAIYADGTCFACDGYVGRPPVFYVGGRASFAPDGFDVAYATRRGTLASVGVDGIGYRRLRRLHGRAPAWSASGRLAFSGRAHRHGRRQILVASHGLRHVRRITGRGGRRPSWSPDGQRIAFVRSGRIFVVDADGRHLQRVSRRRGHAPAWSPSGRRIAFIRGRSGAGKVMTIGPRGRHPRPVGDVRGRSVDWQPLPEQAPAACARPPGATDAPSTGDGVLVSRGRLEFTAYGVDEYDTSFLACLPADGRWRQLFVDSAEISASDSIGHEGTHVSFAAPFVAYLDDTTNKYSAFDSITTIDMRDGSRGRVGVEASLDRSCPYPSFPAIEYQPVRELLVTRNGFTAWEAITCHYAIGLVAKVGAHDNRGTRVLDSGLANAIGPLRLDGDTLTWTHDGEPRSATLG